MNPTTLLYCAMSDIQWCGMRSIASTPRLNADRLRRALVTEVPRIFVFTGA
jgi:hypothetical protein